MADLVDDCGIPIQAPTPTKTPADTYLSLTVNASTLDELLAAVEDALVIDASPPPPAPEPKRKPPRTFLIAPVRGRPPDRWEGLVTMLEKDGWQVHWPARDTDQTETEQRICTANRRAIEACDAVHVIWDGKSEGVLFDLGIAWALRKPMKVLCVDGATPDASTGKSFYNFLVHWGLASAADFVPINRHAARVKALTELNTHAEF